MESPSFERSKLASSLCIFMYYVLYNVRTTLALTFKPIMYSGPLSNSVEEVKTTQVDSRLDLQKLT